jgi:aminopeptidase N
MEYLFVGANYPEYKTWLHFVNDELAAGFGLDALKSSHPIEVPTFLKMFMNGLFQGDHRQPE